MRLFNSGLGAAVMVLLCSSNALALDSSALEQAIKGEEQKLGARIGVAVIDTGTQQVASYRGSERFPFNSTHKALACATLLSQVDQQQKSLTQVRRFTRDQLVDYSPVTEKQVAAGGMTLDAICQASVTMSDNTAANLVIGEVGGPQSVTGYLRKLGDNVSRLDRLEPELNTAIPGDKRDTTSPLAVSQTLQKLLLGNALSADSRTRLTRWMKDDKVADALLRSVLPAGWEIGDKTGAGAYGSRSIISVVWPKDKPPVIVSVYITQTKASMTQNNEAIARLGKVIFDQL